MRALLLIIAAGLLFVFISCNGTTSNDKSVEKNKAGQAAEMAKAQHRFTSAYLPADILYFKKPFTDTLRYTRFFISVQTADTVLIQLLNEVIRETPEKLAGPKKCFSEGKIQLPLGGDAFKVVYFSRLTTVCPYVYTIENGMFHYYKMSAALSDKLTILEGAAPKKQ